jgi:hypothetical protein
MVAYALSIEEDEPSFKKAMQDNNSEEWKAAMDEEMEYLKRTKLGNLLARLPKGK